MLQSMRENMKGAVAIVIVGFLGLIMALSLVDLGANGGHYGQNFTDAAEVNGNKISERDLQIALQQERQRLQAQLGGSLPPEFLSDDRLRGPVLQNLIRSRVVLDKAATSGMTIGNKEIDTFITQQPQFQLDGRFDADTFRQALYASSYTPTEYRNELKQTLAAEQLSSVFNNSSFITEQELERMYGLSRQTRNFSWVSLPIANLPETIIVTNEDIAKEYDANKASYNTEEKVAVEFIELRVNDFTADISVAIEDIQQRFDQERRQNSSIEREAAHIMVDGDNELAETNITSVQEKLADGSVDFAELALQYSDDFATKETGGNLGVSDGSVFPPAFETALENLEVGEVSEAIVIDGATHFIKLLDVVGGADSGPSFEESKARIEAELKTIEAEQIFVERLAELNDLAYNAENLADVADQLGLPVGETSLFTRNGGSDAILNDGRIVNAAFSDQVLLERFSSEVLELAPDYAVVVKLTQHEPVRTQTLEEKSQEIISQLKIKRAKEQLAEQAKELQAALATGKSLDDIAKESSLVINSENNITRENRSLEAELVSHVFALAKPSSEASPVTSSFYLANNDYVLLSLNAVDNADFSTLSEEEKHGARLSLTQASVASEVRAWQSELVNSADIEIIGTDQY